ncbi:hypothetical protein PUN28_006591 [Cardiocondyla obscurior]|uniref:Uncharacterized protein n=1 Tax=Cardiocondyla obscurior TaxID=286306 RepID=A0AAW2GBA8_9HYME
MRLKDLKIRFLPSGSSSSSQSRRNLSYRRDDRLANVISCIDRVALTIACNGSCKDVEAPCISSLGQRRVSVKVRPVSSSYTRTSSQYRSRCRHR